VRDLGTEDASDNLTIQGGTNFLPAFDIEHFPFFPSVEYFDHLNFAVPSHRTLEYKDCVGIFTTSSKKANPPVPIYNDP
jgi:hypothetical protein